VPIFSLQRGGGQLTADAAEFAEHLGLSFAISAFPVVKWSCERSTRRKQHDRAARFGRARAAR